MGYRIRRDRSLLASGGLFGPERRVRQRQTAFYWLTVMVLIGGMVALWQRDQIRPAVMGMFGPVPTSTPSAVEYATRGNLAYIRGNLDDSVASYRAAAQQRPEDVGILYEITRMLIYRSYDGNTTASDDLIEALQWGQRAADVLPSSGRGYTALCFAQMSLETYTEAGRSCLRAIELTPNDPEAHAFLALAYSSTERITEALEEGRRAVGLNPDSIDANISYALILSAVRRYDQALEYYKKAASITPRLEFPYFYLGRLARDLGDDNPAQFDIAIQSYNQVLSTNRRSVKAYMGLCQTYLRKGEPNLARDNCTTATNIAPENTEAWQRLGYVQYFASDYPGAIASLTECYKREGTLPAAQRQAECWYFLGLSYALMNECATALPIFFDLLQWTSNALAIERTNKGLALCQSPVLTTPAAVPPTATFMP